MKKKKGSGVEDVNAPRPERAPASTPDVPRKPRASSPVELAATLRAGSGSDAPPGAMVPPPPAGPTDGVDATGSVPGASQDIESYATILQRRLEAAAPVVEEEDLEARLDGRALRDRLRDGHGLASLLMFRIGDELFATDLAAVEEAVELPEIHRLPEMPAAMLGAFDLRGRLTPVYSPAYVIGVPLRGDGSAALLMRAHGHRIGLAVDDVEDVLQVDLAAVRQAPGNDATDVYLLGVAHHGHDLVALLDAESLVAGCLNGTATETA